MLAQPLGLWHNPQPTSLTRLVSAHPIHTHPKLQSAVRQQPHRTPHLNTLPWLKPCLQLIMQPRLLKAAIVVIVVVCLPSAPLAPSQQPCFSPPFPLSDVPSRPSHSLPQQHPTAPSPPIHRFQKFFHARDTPFLSNSQWSKLPLPIPRS